MTITTGAVQGQLQRQHRAALGADRLVALALNRRRSIHSVVERNERSHQSSDKHAREIAALDRILTIYQMLTLQK
ncbi:MAG TPA: hypothetical protein VJS63_16360 [Bradyrhizobium sp.]|nr:hypothetical protein [Bradyrhizobium sp.]